MQMLISWARWLGALSIWPLDLARSLLQSQAAAWRPAMVEADAAPPRAVAPLAAGAWVWAAASLSRPAVANVPLRSAGDSSSGLRCTTSQVQRFGLTWPFDLARAQHAAGVQAGLLQRSLLASAEFERRLGQLERLALGPLARRV